MRTVSAPELLAAWEKGAAQSQAYRAVTLLALACPASSAEDLERLSIGQRDSLLLALRERMFGQELASVVNCARCEQLLELALSTDDLKVEQYIKGDERLFLAADGLELSFRLPDSRDLAALSGLDDAKQARAVLLRRCVEDVRRGEESVSIDDLPECTIDSMARTMGEADAQASLMLKLACPACGHEWQECFDIDSYIWREISVWASRILREVHTLAAAYGWAEADILNMSSLRRRAYLDLIHG